MRTSTTPEARGGARRRIAWWSALVLVLAGAGLLTAPAASAAPGPAVRFTVTAPSWTTATTNFQVKVTARDSAGNVATGYRGTVRFTTTDPREPVLPANYTFTSADNGAHTFAGVQLHASGDRTITVTDTRTTTIKGTSAVIRVSPGPVARYQVSAPWQATAGVPFVIRVAAKDVWQNLVTSHRGTVSFTSNDPLVRVLPPNYTFTAADRGEHLFSGVTLVSTGNQTIVASDVARPSIKGVDAVRVNNARAVVRGIVLSNFDPLPIQATITVVDADTGLVLASGLTWQDFRFEGMPAGRFIVTASAPDFESRSGGPFTLAPGQVMPEPFDPGGLYLDIPRIGELALFRGWVRVSETGSPIAAAQVSVESAAVSESVVTDAEGYYQFALPFGTYTVSVSAGGFVPQVEVVELDSPDLREASFDLVPASS